MFAQPYSLSMHKIRTDNAIAVEGYVSIKDDEPPRIIAHTIEELTDNDHYVPLEKKEAPQAQPKPATQQRSEGKKIYLRVNDMECKEYKKALNLVDIFEGTTKVIFYDLSSKKYIAYSRGLEATDKVVNELKATLGDANVVLK